MQSETLPDIEAWRWRIDMFNELGMRFAPLPMTFRSEWPQHSAQNSAVKGSIDLLLRKAEAALLQRDLASAQQTMAEIAQQVTHIVAVLTPEK